MTRPSDRQAEEARAGTRRTSRRRGRRVRSGWHRASSARRIATAYLVGVIVTVVVIVALVPGQPRYGADRPWRGVAVDDLREAPTATGWSVDLGAALAPGTPAECLRFRDEPIDDRRVLLRAAGAWTYGFANDGDCGGATAGVGTRLASFDTDLGRVLWVHDVADDILALGLRGPVELASATVVDDARIVVVRARADGQTVLVTLDATTGEPRQQTAPVTTVDSEQFQTAGRTVMTGGQTAEGATYAFQLRDVRDLDLVLWAGPGSLEGQALALPDRLVVARPGGTVQVGLDGRETPWRGDLAALGGYVARPDSIVGPVRGVDRGFAAVDLDGRPLWTSTPEASGSYSTSRTCLTVTDLSDDQLSCVDWTTGEVRWSRPADGASSADGLPGQTDDTVYATVTAPGAGPQSVVALDGETGAARATIALPDGAVLVAASRTVGYALAFGSSGGRSTLVGFDLATGETLWSFAGQLQIGTWAGRFVEVDVDGVARLLEGTTRNVVATP
ncbi:PQQ-binding-like beta-propeller repeat protein [Frigoribacterium sp. CFBP 13712]|uniref:PQQ-binding-like beta-propeller repeat protein n=1 Tax=Frigoribacterium sp. CFBP 13712 TaxID=2775309 RepID=UPI001786CDAA|nr:PQQ-binding-like beta-propeller repeat protein [Frigoribacterium sp. CFBP 13712]MBD8702405.1 PQQ-like beta-propeller repeat protein [Frigoribacterium sp. CFBP 13712]